MMSEQDGSKVGNNEYLNDKICNDLLVNCSNLMESQIRKLRHYIEDWKGIILPAKNVLLWEKNWHPTAIIGATTIIFTLWWLLDPNFLTLVSLIGLILTTCDYLGPSTIANIIRCDEKWNASKDRELDEICTNVVLLKTKCGVILDSYFSLRATKPKLFYILTVSVLSGLIYIGCVLNNLLMGYFLTTLILLSPGIEHNGALIKGTQWLLQTLKISSKDVSKLQPSVTNKKDE